MRLLRELREKSPNDYRNYLHMDDETFTNLLEAIRPRIERQDTMLRKAISNVKFPTIISPQALGHIIPETCKAIYDLLRNKYLKVRLFI